MPKENTVEAEGPKFRGLSPLQYAHMIVDELFEHYAGTMPDSLRFDLELVRHYLQLCADHCYRPGLQQLEEELWPRLFGHCKQQGFLRPELLETVFRLRDPELLARFVESARLQLREEEEGLLVG